MIRFGSKFFRALLAAVILFATVDEGPGQSLPPVAADKFVKIDSDEKLAAQLSEDRLMKYLVHSAISNDDANARIGVGLLEKIVTASLNDGSAIQDIGAALAIGDINLATAMTNFFKSQNYTQQQINDLLNAWAAGKPPQALQAILVNGASRPETIDFLVEYLLDTENSWPRVCANVQLVLQGHEALTPLMLKTNLVDENLILESQIDELMSQAAERNTQARLRLMQAVSELLDKTGTVASYLESTGTTPASWYEKMWQTCERQVANDPLYLTEYVSRLRNSSFLYDKWRSVMLGALDSKEGRDFFAGYYQAARIPGSRFEYTLKYVLPRAEGVEIIGTNEDPKVDQFKGLLMTQLKGSTEWTDYIMWHLTRPAEALCLTLRLSLPNVLGNAPDVCRKLIENMGAFKHAFSDGLAGTSAYSYYGSPETFRARAAEGKLTPEALHDFGAALGQFLATDDRGWDNFFQHLNEFDSPTWAVARDMKQMVIAEAINSDVNTTTILAKTLQTNDARLTGSFSKWLVSNGKSPSPEAVGHWLDSVVSELNRGQVAGNIDVANFKSWFIAFMKTEDGWKALESRLLIESRDVNEALRKAMVIYLVGQDHAKEMWVILRATTASSGSLNFKLVPRLRDYVVRTKLNESLLREISQQNQIATQAVYRVWPELLARDAPTTLSIIQTVEQGDILGDLYSVYAAALIEVVQKNDSRRVLEPIMRNSVPNGANMSYAQLLQAAIQQIGASALKAQPIIEAAMESPQIREAWRIAFLNQVRIMGKGYVVADYLLHQGELQKSWAEKLSNVLTKDPTVMEKIIYALSYKRVRDYSAEGGVDTAEREIAEIMLEDRIMFEQIVANKTTLFSGAFKATVAKELGQATAELWMPSRNRDAAQ